MGCAALLVREVVEVAYELGDPCEAQLADPREVPRTADPLVAAEAVDPDHLDHLEDRICTLSAHIEAASARLLVLIAEFDRLRGWERGGHRSCAHWLAFRTGVDLGTAREKVRVARALESLPLTSGSMARGELSFSQARALTRVAGESNEADLLELARGCTTAQLERMVRAWKKDGTQDEAERERRASRMFSIFPDDEGMYVVKGLLPPEVGVVLMRAIEAASDALFKEAWVPGAKPSEDTVREAARRRADAVGLLAERALAAGFGGAESEPAGFGRGEEEEKLEVRRSRTRAAPISGMRAARYQAILIRRVPAEGEEGDGGAQLQDGTRVSAETFRRLSCDCGVVRMTRDTNGNLLDAGRRTRSIPPALRRALEIRDRGCRFPGCGLPFTDGHHVVHWENGGATSLANCLLLCRHHHYLVHEGGWRVAWWGIGRPVFIDPRGGEHFGGGWKAPALAGDPVAELVRENGRTAPGAGIAGAHWKRETDIPADVLFRATEAALQRRV